MSKILLRSAVITSLFAMGCSGAEPTTSVTKEQIDSANSLLSVYGLSAMPTYDEILKYPAVMTKKADGTQRFPWVDTYWPTAQKNLSRRWRYIMEPSERNTNNNTDFFLASYFSTEMDAIKSNDTDNTIYLAPAEKFDLVYRSQNGDQLTEVNWNLLELKRIEKKQRHVDLSTHSASNNLDLDRGWASDYIELLQSPGKLSRKPLKQLAPMTTEGFLGWLNNAVNTNNQFPGLSNEGADWDWEGICHGWAPAALYSEEPKIAVKVDLKVGLRNKSVIFTEGDIRGLMSKVWADADGNENQFFIGRRCEKDISNPESRGPTNSQGRGVTGQLSFQRPGSSVESTLFTIVQDYPRSTGRQSLTRVILENEWKNGNPTFAYLIGTPTSTGTRNLHLVFEEAQAFAEVQSGQIASNAAPVGRFEMTGCWDVNPASFHTLLVENIGKKNLGFVMDRTQSAQVWNQPVGAAEFNIGALQAVGDIAGKDVAAAYRAPGTAYVAEVTAAVHWGAEPPSPRFRYNVNGDLDQQHSKTTQYVYTLEFDVNKRLIGGEWGALGSMAPKVQNPDFLFGFSKPAEPTFSKSTYLSQGYKSIIKKIHDCSLSDKVDGETTVDAVGGAGKERIPFVNCSL